MSTRTALRKPMDAATRKRMGQAWRTTDTLNLPGTSKTEKRRQPPVPREFPCPTCMRPTAQLKYCDDCTDMTHCEMCITAHRRVHTQRPRRRRTIVPID